MILYIFTCPKKPDMKRHLLSVLPFILIPVLLSAQPKINFNKVTGVIKPVNGVGQPPLYSWVHTDLFHYLKEAGIPYSRLHDVGGPFGMNIYVDIPNIFRDFDADENENMMWTGTWEQYMDLYGTTAHLNEKLDRVPSSLDNWSVCLLLLERKE